MSAIRPPPTPEVEGYMDRLGLIPFSLKRYHFHESLRDFHKDLRFPQRSVLDPGRDVNLMRHACVQLLEHLGPLYLCDGLRYGFPRYREDHPAIRQLRKFKPLIAIFIYYCNEKREGQQSMKKARGPNDAPREVIEVSSDEEDVGVAANNDNEWHFDAVRGSSDRLHAKMIRAQVAIDPETARLVLAPTRNSTDWEYVGEGKDALTVPPSNQEAGRTFFLTSRF
ncbi:hypothetical protein MMC13_000505 [Lambiella insularis]|nr:hypothetical protein [Lambiella insularis]